MEYTADITERQLESQIKDLAKIFGWKYYHTWRSIHSPAGFPDCVMVRPPRLIFAELKSAKGKVTSEQQSWLNILELCKHDIQYCIQDNSFSSFQPKLISLPEVYLWRPSDLEPNGGRIADILQLPSSFTR